MKKKEKSLNSKLATLPNIRLSVMANVLSASLRHRPEKGYIECTFRKAGRVTSGLDRLEEGMTMGVRAPLGNSFPIEDWKGKNLVFVAGGIALPPMRAVIDNVLDRRDEFGDVTIVYGAKTVNDLVYKDELKEWEERPDVNLFATVDPWWRNS
jgi:sulfhydrogenase subunit gamma (sulfur reductase)